MAEFDANYVLRGSARNTSMTLIDEWVACSVVSGYWPPEKQCELASRLALRVLVRVQPLREEVPHLSCRPKSEGMSKTSNVLLSLTDGREGYFFEPANMPGTTRT